MSFLLTYGTGENRSGHTDAHAYGMSVQRCGGGEG